MTWVTCCEISRKSSPDAVPHATAILSGDAGLTITTGSDCLPGGERRAAWGGPIAAGLLKRLWNMVIDEEIEWGRDND